jgi:hypothetical protein
MVGSNSLPISFKSQRLFLVVLKDDGPIPEKAGATGRARLMKTEVAEDMRFMVVSPFALWFYLNAYGYGDGDL